MRNLSLWQELEEPANHRIFVGDNLAWLRDDALRPLHQAVQVIYIDPPYNTKTDKSYRDRFHSTAWRDGIRERIAAAQVFLRQTGVLFISIDDNEYAGLKITCDEIFGEENFIGTFITRQAQRSNSKLINTTHEYILAYAKDKEAVRPFSISRMDIPEQREMIVSLSDAIQRELYAHGREAASRKLAQEIRRICAEMNITWLKNYNCIDEAGRIFFGKDLSTPGTPREVYIPEIGLHLLPLKTRGWSSDEKFISLHRKGRLAYKGTRPYEIHYLHESTDSAPSVLNFYSRQGSNDLNKLGLRDLFDTPKPVALIKFLIRLVAEPGDVVMDFYAGSGTTAQAVYEINQEDQKNLSYVLIQHEEPLNQKSKSYDACRKLKIKPSVPALMLRRIDTWLHKNDMEPDYTVFQRPGEKA
ncbi:MAG: site-specific DNA-methyltransferase [Deltaproteobacteria bacterium]|nr:site-specific DNA-methyltransferase [Deltaproteobacteria bacterium]